MVLAALFGVWLLKRTSCINTRFIIPPAPIAVRTFLRKTRRGWIAGMARMFNQRGLFLRDIAWNAATGALADEEKDALLRECFDLDPDASDDDVRQAANAFRADGAADNAARKQRHAEACNALGLDESADADDIHDAVLEATKAEKEAKAANAKLQKRLMGALLDNAITAGRITQAQREIYETAFNADFEGTAAKLRAEGKKLNTEPLNMNGRKEGASTVKELGAKVQLAVNDLMENKKMDYIKAWNTVKADKQYADYFYPKKPEVAVS